MSKIKLPSPNDRLSIELDANRVLCNEVVLPGERHPRNRRLWAVAHEHGFMGAVWADNEEEALDELADADLAKGIILDEESLTSMSENDQEHLAEIGNNSLPADLSNVRVIAISWEPARDWKLLCKFAEARGAGADTLGDL